MRTHTLYDYEGKQINLSSVYNEYDYSNLYNDIEPLKTYASLILELALTDEQLSHAITSNSYGAVHSIMRCEYMLEINANRITDFNIDMDSIKACHLDDLDEL